MTIDKLVSRRSGGKLTPKPDDDSKNPKDIENKKSMPTKEICFQIDKLGAVGESILHTCMLNGTSVYIELSKRLLMHFPKMVKDFYMGEDYFGKFLF